MQELLIGIIIGFLSGIMIGMMLTIIFLNVLNHKEKEMLKNITKFMEEQKYGRTTKGNRGSV